MNNPWDNLSSFFNASNDKEEIPSIIADNLLIAGSEILNFIKQNSLKGKNMHLLEYGCGNGSFAYTLQKLGYNVTGVDSSASMIKIAKAAYGDKVKFLAGDSSILSTLTPFSIITSIMTFQFIENIERTFKEINNILKPGGIFIFAVHNPEEIKEYIPLGILFQDFDSNKNPKKGMLNIDGNKIPIFIRTAQEYNEILQPLGFVPLLEKYPPFTKEFLEKYPYPYPTDPPEYLILGYKKKS